MAANYMTAEGLKTLKEELQHMTDVERPAISQQIAEARDKGDLSENAEYDAAKEAQGMLEGRIALLKEKIATARILDKSKINTDTVQVLTSVTIKNCKNKTVRTYTLVSEAEADLKANKLSIGTPIAQGLLGKKVGDIVEVTVPSGIVKFEIIKISI